MKSRVKIAHFLASNFFGGPEKQLLEHVQRLGSSSFSPHVLSFEESGKENQLLQKTLAVDIPTTAIKSVNPVDPRMILDVLKTIREEHISVLCVHGYKANVIGRIASWVAGIPVIAISRGWTGEAAKIRFFEWLDKLFLRFADHIVAVSHGQKEKIIKLGISPHKISVIHNCISVSNEVSAVAKKALRSELGLTNDAILVVSAGRLSPEKNFSGMIEVAQQVVKQKPNVVFIIFGEGFLRKQLELQIYTAGLNRNFFLPGFRYDLQAILPEVDIFMLPSFTEGLPNVILEAFAAGKPVVATAVGGTPEVVEDGISGFLTTPQETAAMATHILRLADDPALREAMGTNGFERVKKYFDFEQQTREYEALYATVHNHCYARPQ